MPSRKGRDRGWEEFSTSVEDVERLMGYNFFQSAKSYPEAN